MEAANLPRLAVVIPAYNSAGVLPETLRHITHQLASEDELIVVDDGSTDNTRPVAEEHRARVVVLEENSGPATARTRGAEAASAEVLVFTDTDVWLPEDALATIREAFANPEIHALQGVFSEECPDKGFISQYKNLYNRFVLMHLPDRIDTTYTSLTAVRREAFFDCGGFDLNIRGASVEDRTLGRNLVRAGYDIHLRRDLEVIHNKALTLGGFIRNQYRRSRDLMKLKQRSKGETAPGEEGRFGTNTRRAMLRIPAAYLLLAAIVAVPVLTFVSPDPLRFRNLSLAAAVALALGVVFLWLAADFLEYLRRTRGAVFALRAVDTNFLDALVCGVGVLAGWVGYKLGRRY